MAIDRERVLTAGLHIADERGLEALTMRGLAATLKVTPMALYNHVADLADLRDGMAELVAREIGRPSARWPWRRRLRAVLLDMRRACLAHPAGAQLLQATRALTPPLLQPVESALDALADAGLKPQAARAAWAALVGLTFGHVSYQLAGHMAGAGSADLDAYPRLAATVGRPALNWDRAFAQALDALIDGLTGGDASR